MREERRSRKRGGFLFSRQNSSQSAIVSPGPYGPTASRQMAHARLGPAGMQAASQAGLILNDRANVDGLIGD